MTKQQNMTKEQAEPKVVLTREQAMNCLVFLENTTVQGKVAPAFMSLVSTLQEGLRASE